MLGPRGEPLIRLVTAAKSHFGSVTLSVHGDNLSESKRMTCDKQAAFLATGLAHPLLRSIAVYQSGNTVLFRQTAL